MRPRLRWSSAFLQLVTVLGLFVAGLAGPATDRAHAAAAFGDSGWVAPSPIGAIDGDFTAAGPRVADRDVEPVGESILRAPFRVAFLPLRLLARGLEGLAGVVGEGVLPRRQYGSQSSTGFTFGPTFGYSGGPGPAIGLRATNTLDPEHASRWSVVGTWSLRDTRKASFDYRRGAPTDGWGLIVRAQYGLRPNQRFYGIGNDASRDDRAIWLGETGGASALVRFGPPKTQLRLTGAWQSISARRGWNDSPGVLDVFPLAEVPGMLESFTAFSVGAIGDLAAVDDLRDPASGIHLRAEARQVLPQSDTDYDHQRYHLEARAYLPVFSKRRVLAARALHQSVHPPTSTTALPFYWLPESADVSRFAAYPAHRFMDRHLALAHLEYRWLIWDRLWALGLAEVGQVAHSAEGLGMNDVHESYGGGLRYAFSSSSVVRVQVAKGSEGVSAYVTLKEDF
jgi:hypothetical protein